MKSKFQKLCITIFSIWILAGCTSKDTMQNNSLSTQPEETKAVSTVTTNESDAEDTVNKYFFPDIITQPQYDYEGSIWGMAINANESLEGHTHEELFAEATLNVTEVAQLTKGKVYELKFVIHGKEVSPRLRETNIYLWVSNEAIYYLSPPDNFDYKEFIIDNRFDDLAYAKMLEETRQLPNDEKRLILCYDTNMELQDGAYETKISVEGDTCTYSTSHNSGHFTKYEWKVGEGLNYYAYGYGAEGEGVVLRRVQ